MQEPETREVADSHDDGQNAGNTVYNDSYDDSSSNINQEIDEGDRDREKGIFARLQEEVMGMWQMLASRKRAGDEGTMQESGVQVESVQGDSQAQLSVDGGEHDGGQGDGNGGGDGGNYVAHDGYDNDSDEDDKNDDSDAAAQKAWAERLEELSRNPAKGGSVSPNRGRREAEVGLQLEERGQLAGPIIRDPSGTADFVDRKGTLWDIKQFHSAKGRFELEKAVSDIKEQLDAGENVILDTEFLAPKDVVALRRAVETQGWQDRILWTYEPPLLDEPFYPDWRELENEEARSLFKKMVNGMRDHFKPLDLKGAWRDLQNDPVPHPGRPDDPFFQHLKEVRNTLQSCHNAIELYNDPEKKSKFSSGDRLIMEALVSRASKAKDYVEKVIYRDQWLPGDRSYLYEVWWPK